MWTVISRSQNSNSGHSQWLCRCDCGIEKIVRGSSLKQGRTRSCSCSSAFFYRVGREGNLLNKVLPHLYEEWSSRNTHSFDSVTCGSGEKFWWLCPLCSYEWKAAPYTRSKGHGCPSCNIPQHSNLEKRIKSYLIELDIPFDCQYSIKRVKNGKRNSSLRLDFLVHYKGRKIGIECQGSHHYIPTNFGSKNKTPEECFDEIVCNDESKVRICKSLGIPLVEIPYYVKNKKNYLIKILEEGCK
jgi:hypothetical protein